MSAYGEWGIGQRSKIYNVQHAISVSKALAELNRQQVICSFADVISGRFGPSINEITAVFGPCDASWRRSQHGSKTTCPSDTHDPGRFRGSCGFQDRLEELGEEEWSVDVGLELEVHVLCAFGVLGGTHNAGVVVEPV